MTADMGGIIEKQSLFINAAASNDLPLLEKLSQENAEFETPFLDKNTLGAALREAASEKALKAAHFVIAEGAPMNQPDDQGFTPIDFAAWNGDTDMFKALMDAGASAQQLDSHGLSPQQNAGQLGVDLEKAEAIRSLIKEYDAYYTIQGATEFSKRNFFSDNEYAYDGYGYSTRQIRSPLNHHDTWNQIDGIFEYYDNKKYEESIGLKDLLRTNNNGDTWLDRGVACRALDKIVSNLNKRGEAIGAELLLDEDGQATPLLEQIALTRQLQAVFTIDNMKHSPEEDIRKILDAVPEEQQGQVGNLHSLVTAHKRHVAHQQEEAGEHARLR